MNARIEDLGRRIDCPVPWCEGRWLDHGGDGSDPGDWLHDDGAGFTLPEGAELHRSQIGGDPFEWSLILQGDGCHFSLGSASPAEYARRLRAIADELDTVTS